MAIAVSSVILGCIINYEKQCVSTNIWIMQDDEPQSSLIKQETAGKNLSHQESLSIILLACTPFLYHY